MNIYVAAHSQAEARKVADILAQAGHEITSTWLQEDMEKDESLVPDERASIAIKDLTEIKHSDALVMLAAPYRVPGGKFVELGFALGIGIHVHLIGHRENMLMWHPSIHQHDSAENLVKVLA